MTSPKTHPALRPGATALITGSASGIGLAVAHSLADTHSMNIILVDWDSSKLEKAKTSFKEGDENHWVKSFVVDVGKEEDWKVLKGKLEDEDEDEDVKGIDFLMLNAGVGGPTGGWEDVGYFKRVRMLYSSLFLFFLRALVFIIRE